MSSQPKINIMHVIHGLPADGAEQLLVDIIKKSNQDIFRHSVTCIVDGGPLVKELEDFGINVTVLKKRFKCDISTIPKLISLLSEQKIHILHSHMFTGYFWGTIAAFLARTPVNITTNHSTAHSKTKLQLIIERLFAPITNTFINISKEAFDSLSTLTKIPLKKLELIPNGIDLDRFAHIAVEKSTLKKALGLNPDKITIAMISRLVELKGHKFLFDAAASLLKKRNDLQFLIVGDGEFRPELEQKVNASPLLQSNVIFTGVRRDIAAIMQIVDLFVIASLWEGLPIVLLEAMAMEKKILATKVGGIPEVLEDKISGLLISPGSAEEICEGLTWILNHPTESDNMAKNARSIVYEHYNVKLLVQKYESLYKKLLAKNTKALFPPKKTNI